MAMKRMPHEIIRDLSSEYDKLSDSKVLAKLRDIPALPDEDDPAWDQAFWSDIAYPYLALCGVSCARGLRKAIPLILDRICFGDPGETMRGMCHVFEGIVKPNWFELTPYCVAALSSKRPGTRLWAAHQLARLRDPASLSELEAVANDPVPRVRECIEMALESTCEASRNAKPPKKRKS